MTRGVFRVDRARRAACAALIAVVLHGAVALAQGSDASERRTLLDQAEQARTASRHDDALAFARRALAIKSSSSLRRFIAEELVALGRSVQAYDEAERCEAEARKEPPSPNHDAVLAGCIALGRDLAAKVAVVTFDWGGALPDGASVVGNGEPLDPSHDNAVAPGPVDLEARAPGSKPVSQHLELDAGERRAVVVRFAAIQPERPVVSTVSNAVQSPQSAPMPRHVPPAAARELDRSPGSGAIGGPIVAGVGAASVATGVALFIASQSRYDDLRGRCGSGGCSASDPQIVRDRQRIETLDRWGNVTVISGLAVAAAGVTWFIFDRRPDAPSAGSARARLRVSLGGLALDASY